MGALTCELGCNVVELKTRVASRRASRLSKDRADYKKRQEASCSTRMASAGPRGSDFAAAHRAARVASRSLIAQGAIAAGADMPQISMGCAGTWERWIRKPAVSKTGKSSVFDPDLDEGFVPTTSRSGMQYCDDAVNKELAGPLSPGGDVTSATFKGNLVDQTAFPVLSSLLLPQRIRSQSAEKLPKEYSMAVNAPHLLAKDEAAKMVLEDEEAAHVDGGMTRAATERPSMSSQLTTQIQCEFGPSSRLGASSKPCARTESFLEREISRNPWDDPSCAEELEEALRALAPLGVNSGEYEAAFRVVHSMFGILERKRRTGAGLPRHGSGGPNLCRWSKPGAQRLGFLLSAAGPSKVFPLRLNRKWIALFSTPTCELDCYPEKFDTLEELNASAAREDMELWIGRPQTVHAAPCRVFAHRGAGATNHWWRTGAESIGDEPDLEALDAGYVPENTHIAFREGLFQGCDGLEFDVYVTKDGHNVVVHDDILEMNSQSLSKGERKSAVDAYKAASADPAYTSEESDAGNSLFHRVTDMTCAEVQSWAVGRHHTIPLLCEVLDLIVVENRVRRTFGHPRVVANIDLKGKGTGSAVARLLNSRDREGKVSAEDFQLSDILVCSFSWQELVDFHNGVPGTPSEGGSIRAKRSRKNGPFVSPSVNTWDLFGEENVGDDYSVKEGSLMHDEYLKQWQGWYANVGGPQRGDYVDIVAGDVRHAFLDAVPEGVGLALFIPVKDINNESACEWMRWALYVGQKHQRDVILKVDEPFETRRKLMQMSLEGDTSPRTSVPPKIVNEFKDDIDYRSRVPLHYAQLAGRNGYERSRDMDAKEHWRKLKRFCLVSLIWGLFKKAAYVAPSGRAPEQGS